MSNKESNAQNCLQLQHVFASKHILYIEAVYLYQSLSCLHCKGKVKGKVKTGKDKLIKSITRDMELSLHKKIYIKGVVFFKTLCR